jgi:OOP family OmpA-OmpF porin
MTTSFTKKQLTLAVACALALGFASNAARAQTASAPEQSRAEAVDRSLVTAAGGQVWRNGFGECWHAGFGPAPLAGAECNPQPMAQYIAPAAAVAPAPAPYVAPAAAATPTVYEKVSFDADALFDFDKAVLRPEGRAALDSFISDAKDVTPSTISVIGHTDRLGSDSYNQTLSEERAAAVKSYLVSRGINANSVQTEGKGEMQPVTKTADCKGGKSATLIACLQPDRRVEVEVSGSRIKQ